jgi:cytochrome c
MPQASQIVSYILSVKDENNHTSTMPSAGVIIPDKSGGDYILSVTYRDKDRMGVGANTVKKNYHFRYPRLRAVAADDDKTVAKFGESNVRFTANGSWLLFKNIDLTGISSILFNVDPSQIGGTISVRLGSPDGKEVGSVSIDQKKRPQKTGADQKDNAWTVARMKTTPQAGVHDLYIVYTDPKDAQSGMWTTLYLDWIEFQR